jgi:hypothetical protein
MATVLEHFRDGGWGMFPTLLFGLLLMVVAIRYAGRPEKRFVPLLVTLNLLTLASGALGCVSGVIVTAHAFEAASPPLPSSIPFLGVGESLNNVAFALLFVVVGAMAVSLGAWKIAQGHDAEIIRAR